MQQIRILSSDYHSFMPAIGKIVDAIPCGRGWVVPVGESLKHDPHSVWQDEARLPISEQPALYFARFEVEVVETVNPFAYWNAIKSGTHHVNKGIAR